MLNISISPLYTTCILGILYGISFRANFLSPLLGLFVIGYSCKHFIAIADHKHKFFQIMSYFVCFFCSSMYWVGFPFTTIQMGYLGPIAVFCFAMMLSCFHLPIALSFSYLKRYPKFGELIFALSFFGCEMLRSHLFTGLPWNLAGHLWGMLSLSLSGTIFDLGLSMMQLSHWITIYGLSFFTIILAIYYQHHNKKYRLIALGLTLVCIVAGEIRLSKNPTTYSEDSPIVRIIQPCIDPNKKWSIDHFYSVLQEQMELSIQKSQKDINAIIWPEAAVPAALNLHPELRSELARIIPRNGYLITGSITNDVLRKKHYSSIVAMNHFGEITQTHNKVHLLPFGEYIPFKNWLPVDKFTPGATDYTPGDFINIMNIHNLPPFIALICYEAIFSKEISSQKNNLKPKWILNLTNDAWFQDSHGLWQHLANVRFRSIEEGLPLVRVANNGISVVTDHVGRIIQKTRINEKTFIDISVPIR